MSPIGQDLADFKPRDPGFADKVAQSFTRQGMMETLGARLALIRPGLCEIRAPVRPETSQQAGFAHAGLTFAIGDSAAGYAALSLMEPEAEVLTVEMKINLIAPADGSELLARGRVIRPGRRLVVVAAEVFSLSPSGNERSVAILQGTMIPV